MMVYAGDDEEYFTFISAEAWRALKEWMNYREISGEIINGESWVMRDLWDTRVAQGRGLVTKPKKLTALGVKRLMERAIWAQGLRKKLEPGKKRHPYQANHSLRKWFKTRCEIAGMKPINIEKLMNHSVGISDSYYRATENEVLEDYLKAVDFLAINEENGLKLKVQELTEKTQDNEYIIQSKLQDKDKQIQAMNEKYDLLQSQIQTIFSALSNADQSSKNELSKQLLQNGFFETRRIAEQDNPSPCHGSRAQDEACRRSCASCSRVPRDVASRSSIADDDERAFVTFVGTGQGREVGLFAVLTRGSEGTYSAVDLCARPWPFVKLVRDHLAGPTSGSATTSTCRCPTCPPAALWLPHPTAQSSRTLGRRGVPLPGR